ncbi:hypothetical protein CSC06_1073 [Escherichia coli]|nr:hypothetical protein CSC06_1073 [Escherichia coli]
MWQDIVGKKFSVTLCQQISLPGIQYRVQWIMSKNMGSRLNRYNR